MLNTINGYNNITNTVIKNNAKICIKKYTIKLPNLLLSLRKSSQDISEQTCKWIPLPTLDRE